MSKWSRVLPVLEAQSSLVTSTEIDADGKDDESNDGQDLDGGKPEFSLSVSSGTKHVDGDDDDEEDCDEDGRVEIRPEGYQDGSSREFGRQDDEPVKGVVVAWIFGTKRKGYVSYSSRVFSRKRL